MDAFLYCPVCGFHENFDYDGTDLRLDVERHCGECNSKMITHCLNEECPQFIIESLDRNYCPCGRKYPNIEITRNRNKKIFISKSRKSSIDWDKY